VSWEKGYFKNFRKIWRCWK